MVRVDARACTRVCTKRAECVAASVRTRARAKHTSYTPARAAIFRECTCVCVCVRTCCYVRTRVRGRTRSRGERERRPFVKISKRPDAGAPATRDITDDKPSCSLSSSPRPRPSPLSGWRLYGEAMLNAKVTSRNKLQVLLERRALRTVRASVSAVVARVVARPVVVVLPVDIV